MPVTSYKRPLSLALQAAPLFAVWALLASPIHALVDFPSSTLTLQTTASTTYDSYVVGTTNPGDDVIGTLRPQLTYAHKIGPTQLTAYTGVSFNRYYTNTQFDSNDLSLGVSSNFPVAEGSRLNGQISATYNEMTQVDPLINDRVATKNYSLSLTSTYATGLKTSLSDTINYSRNERKAYGNQQIASNSLTFGYTDFLEDTNLRLNHNYTRTQSSASNYANWVFDPTAIGNTPDTALDQTANALTLGLAHPIYGKIIGEATCGYMTVQRSANETTSGNTRNSSATYGLSLTGPFLPPARFPKLDSSATVSYQQSMSPGINDSGSKSLQGSAQIGWNARERTHVSWSLSRSMGLGSNNFTVISTSTAFNVSEKIGMATSLTGNVSYNWRSYRGLSRSDTVLGAGLNLNHTLSQHWSLGSSYSFQDNKTDTPAGSFQATRFQIENNIHHVFNFSANCVY